MKRLSTPYGFGLKAFPYLFCGFLGVMLFLVISSLGWRKSVGEIVTSVAFAAFGVLIWWINTDGIADEVFDLGDHLLVRQNDAEARVPLADIVNVNFKVIPRPARITLTLDKPCELGSEIVFAPPPDIYISAFPKNPIAENLLARSILARGKRGA